MQRIDVYLIGGMGKFGKDRFKEGDEWRGYFVHEFAKYYSRKEVHIINPNGYYNFLDDSNYDSQREIMEFDINKVRGSKFCICNFNDPGSLGSMAELAIAYERRIPVIGLNENGAVLHPWQEEMCSKILKSKEDVLFYALNYYLD